VSPAHLSDVSELFSHFLSQLATLLKQFGVATTDDLVPLIYAGLVDPLLAVRAQVEKKHIFILHVQFILHSIMLT
jgi:hypothetical protein